MIDRYTTDRINENEQRIEQLEHDLDCLLEVVSDLLLFFAGKGTLKPEEYLMMLEKYKKAVTPRNG